MSMMRPLTIAVAIAAALSTAQLAAGTSFRLEIGSAAALGAEKKFTKDSKKVVVAVRAVVCEDLANVKVTGTAEGLVNGKRQSLPLTLAVVNPAEAVYAIPQQWPENGTWVLHLKGSCSNPKAEASTLVAMSKTGFIRDRSVVLREPATRKQLEDAIADLARSQS